METQEKPKVSYADFVASQKKPKFKEGTIAWLIQRYINEMNGWSGKPPVRELGGSHLYTLRLLQRMPIGALMAMELTKAHVVDHCRLRQSEGVKPQTVNQDITYLSGAMKYAPWLGLDDITSAAVEAAKPYLKKHNLISKSTPRERRPQAEEVAAIEVLAAQANLHPCNKIDMVRFTRWQVASGRRLSESCRIVWLDWDWAGQTMIVHKMKDPKNRNKTKRVALTVEAQAMLLDMAEEMNANRASWADKEPRIFPYNPKSTGAKYTRLKHAAGIKDLHLHDSRAECASRLVEQGYTPAQAIQVTSHETTAIFERNYMRLGAEHFTQGPLGKRKEELA